MDMHDQCPQIEEVIDEECKQALDELYQTWMAQDIMTMKEFTTLMSATDDQLADELRERGFVVVRVNSLNRRKGDI